MAEAIKVERPVSNTGRSILNISCQKVRPKEAAEEHPPASSFSSFSFPSLSARRRLSLLSSSFLSARRCRPFSPFSSFPSAQRRPFSPFSFSSSRARAAC
ncbi:MAG: hypothetical protein KF868_22550, partial [Acidobacteria bacterium]|nr:hypothetical protein [Acidobacteriota bacterium]